MVNPASVLPPSAVSTMGVLAKPTALDKVPAPVFDRRALYDKVIKGLSGKNSLDHDAVCKAIDLGVSTLRSLHSAERVEGISLQFSQSDHIILYLSKGKEKAISFSGEAQPKKGRDAAFIAQGTFGLVQKAGDAPKFKALKTIKQEKGPEAKRDIENSINVLKNLHAAHPKGKVPGLDTPPKSVRVALTDPVSNATTFIQGALSPLREGDLFDLVPQPSEPSLDEKKLEELLVKFTPVFGATAFMHTQGMAHRDIKVGNIFYDSKGFYLADFGGVKKPQEWTDDSYMSGTPQYMAEQDTKRFEKAYKSGNLQEAQKILEKMDVFALAAALYECILGMTVIESLYEESSTLQGHLDTAQSIDGAFTYLESLYGSELETFMRDALSPNLDDRPSAAECELRIQKMKIAAP